MKYTVLWSKSAETRLAELWLGAADPQAIRRACDDLDTQLAERPTQIGESRSENVRIAFESPIAVEYRVFEKHHVVIVGGIWAYSVLG